MTWTQHDRGEWHAETPAAHLRVVMVAWRRWHWSIVQHGRTAACGVCDTMARAQRVAAAALEVRQ